MKVLVTAGSTRTMIDQVRCITNIFKGRTGHNIAAYFSMKNNEVTLITSGDANSFNARNIIEYRTYDELYDNMKEQITENNFDVVIHSAAVSDYRPEGTYIDEGGPTTRLKKLDSSGKVGSDHKVLYLKMVQTEKIIDKIRDPWGFKGKLVKFKLQVDITDEKLLEIARKSRKHSDADIIVANCLEWSSKKAYIVSSDDLIEQVKRESLPQALYDSISS